MIDTLQRIAERMTFLRWPALGVAALCLGIVTVDLLMPDSAQGSRFLVPSIIGIIWSLAAYSFIVTFESIPARADRSDRFVTRLKQRIRRGWYWLVALLFIGTTAFALILTGRLFSVWMRS